MIGRFALSRSPADPNTTRSSPPRAAASGASRSSTFSSAAGLCAKSTITPNGWPRSTRSIRPATPVQQIEACPNGRRIELERLPEGHDAKGVVGVETAGELEVERSPSQRRRRVDRRAAGGHPPRCGSARTSALGSVPYVISRAPDSRTTASKIGAWASSRLTIPTRGHGRFLGRGGGVGACRGPWARQLLEQAQLRVAVGLEGAVQLEVLVGDVREDGDVVGDPGDSFERQPVRRRLDDREPVAGHHHRPQRHLQLGRLRGSWRGSAFALADRPDLRLDRPDRPGRQSGRFERRHGERAGRALAVGAGDAHDPDLEAWVAVPPRRGRGQRLTRRRRPRAAVAADVADRPLDERGRRRRAAAASARCSWPSTCSPAHRHEQRSSGGAARRS